MIRPQNIKYETTTALFLADVARQASDNNGKRSVADMRQDASSLQMRHTLEMASDVDIVNETVEGRTSAIAVRIYQKKVRSAPHPALIFCHGGGWVLHGLDEYDGVCSYLAKEGDVTIVSVDYRLAPEHKYPAAFEDCFDVAIWASEHNDLLGGLPSKIGIGGDSVGGNLAAAVAQRCTSLDALQLDRQILLYPCLASNAEQRFTSRREYGQKHHFLCDDDLQNLIEMYRRSDDDELDPCFWPLLTEDLSNLPDTYIVTAEYDLLHDEAHAYADRLSQAGVQVKKINYAGTIHGFIGFAGTIHPGLRALEELCAYLRNW